MTLDVDGTAEVRVVVNDLDPDLVTFCDLHHRRVVNLISGIVADRSTAEDLAQEAFLRVHLHWRKMSGLDRPDAWLNRVAVNLANSWWRRRQREWRANRDHTSVRRHPRPDEPATAVALRAAVASLPKRQRTVIALRYFGGLSVNEAAAVMKCRPGTVKSLTSKGMTGLRARLDIDPHPVADVATGPALEGSNHA